MIPKVHMQKELVNDIQMLKNDGFPIKLMDKSPTPGVVSL